MRSRMLATAAVAAAFVMFPAGSALAGSGPVTGPSAAANSTAPTPQGNPSSAKAQAADVCEDARQIGATGYIKRDGATIASWKQFYSADCKENYSYVWVWQDFVDAEDDYNVGAGVYSYDKDETLGTANWTADNGQEYWSRGADTADDCTAAVGTLRPAGSATTLEGQSDKRC
jgi:hypothetical protein